VKAGELRALQAPLKERYRAEPEVALVTLRASGRLEVGKVVNDDRADWREAWALWTTPCVSCPAPIYGEAEQVVFLL
jgi:hypothetical protein